MNELFRAWTRGTTFTLNMGRAQVAVLCALHGTPDGVGFHIGWGHPRLSHWVTGTKGLEERGLVLWTEPTLLAKRLKRSPTMKEVFAITDAGQHVIELLKISGVYQELIADFIRVDKSNGRISRTAV